MSKWLLAVIILIFLPSTAFARTTPNDQYLQKRASFENNLSKIADSSKQEKVRQADRLLSEINQRASQRFDEDILRLGAILEEIKVRKSITKTTVAYGARETPLDSAAYWVNFAAEAVAFQKIQDYTPQISGNNLVKPIISSRDRLKGDLEILKGKILKAKREVEKALEYEQ